MRNSLIGLAVILGIVGGYLFTRNLNSTDASVSTPAPIVAETSSVPPQAQLTGGSEHARETHQPHVRKSSKARRQNEGSAGPLAASPVIPSLYSGEGDSPSEGDALGVEGQSGDQPVAEQVRPKIIHGVAVDAWADLQRNALAKPAVTRGGDQGMRVIFQCHEMKKGGAEYVGNRSCGEMAAKSREGTAAVTGRGSERIY